MKEGLPIASEDGGSLELDRDRITRETFLLGFIVLLALILGTGVIGYRRVAAIENELTDRSSTNQRNLALVLQLDQHAGMLAAETRSFEIARATGMVTHPSIHRIGQIRKTINDTIETGRATEFGATPEWKEMEQAFAAYRSALDTVDGVPDAVESRFNESIGNLIHRVRQDVLRTQEEAKRMRTLGQRDIALTTGACFAVGVIISILSFIETRRRIAMIRAGYSRAQRSREFIENVLNSMDNAVLTVDEHNLVTRINGSALYVLGFQIEQEVVGKEITEILAGEPRLLDVVMPVVESPGDERRYLGRIEIGDKRWLFDVGAAPLIFGGEQKGFILTLSDVTQAERANEELRRNRALMAIGQMTAQVAHEIKNPLGGVRFAAQILARKLSGDEESLEVVRRLESCVNHLNRTVIELNQFARPKDLHREPTHMEEFIEDLISFVADKLDEKRIEVVREYPDDLPPLLLDAGELRKAFLNFLLNGLEASPPGSQLLVHVDEVAEPEPAIRILVRDEGEGMDEETKLRLFEPFFTTKSQGTGLGMAIARKIIDQHDGRLEIESTLGEGTSVTVTLPIVPATIHETIGGDGA